MANKKTLFLIDSLFPDHVVANYPRLIEFAKAFFEYLETENKAAHYQNTLYLQRDVYEQDPEFADYIKRELGILSRRNFSVDPKLFYDNIVDIWKSKGSEESIKTFFRIFLNDEVEIFYPWESVLIPSDGRWIVNQVLRVTLLPGSTIDVNNFAGKTIIQTDTGATAVVSGVKTKNYRTGTIYELSLVPPTIVDKFIAGKQIVASDDTTLRAEVYRSVSDLKIIEKGTNYQIGDKIKINGYNGISFSAYVSAVDEVGGILEVNIVDFGAGNTPLSIANSENRPRYFYKDFFIYTNTHSIVDELRDQGISDFFINIRKNTLTSYKVNEHLQLVDGVTGTVRDTTSGSSSDEYVATSDFYFAEDYVTVNGEEDSFNQETITGVTETEEQFTGLLGPAEIPIVVLSENGSGAQFEIQYSPVPSYSGYYDGVKGQLSESIVLHDSEYYQKYSYEIKTKYSENQWIEPLKKMVHPAGIEVVANVTAFDEEPVGIKDSYIFVRSRVPPSYTLTQNALITDIVTGYSQSYVTNENDNAYFAEDYVADKYFGPLSTSQGNESVSETLQNNPTFTDL